MQGLGEDKGDLLSMCLIKNILQLRHWWLILWIERHKGHSSNLTKGYQGNVLPQEKSGLVLLPEKIIYMVIIRFWDPGMLNGYPRSFLVYFWPTCRALFFAQKKGSCAGSETPRDNRVSRFAETGLFSYYICWNLVRMSGRCEVEA